MIMRFGISGGFVPPAVAAEIEFRRRQRGLSQRELARLIGRSQGQLANALRGHDPMSAVSVNRLRDVLNSRQVSLKNIQKIKDLA